MEKDDVPQQRRILFTLCGLSPQILTENLYCLMVDKNIWIDEIWMISTESGKAFAEERLLDIHRGMFYAFCREYDIDASRIMFNADHIIAADDLADVRSLDDNRAFANILTGKLQQLTQDDNTILYCSIAGGRKSMSAYLAMLMQFFARPQDKLYHTLVHPADFENHLEYFFPPKKDFLIHTRSGKVKSTADVLLEMHEIPFIRLREKIPEFQQEVHSYSKMVDIAQSWISSPAQFPHLHLNNYTHQIQIGNKCTIQLQHFPYILYRYFAEKSLARPENIKVDDHFSYFVQGGKNFSQTELDIIKSMARSDCETLDWDRIQQELSRIKKQFASCLPDFDMLDYYLVTKVGGRGDSRYGIKLDKEFIAIL